MNPKEALKTLADAIEAIPRGSRHIVVLDRGWIFVGNLEADSPAAENYTLTNVLNVRTWKQGGFGALSLSAKEAGAVLDKSAPLKFHRSAVIFMVPVGEAWDA